VVVEREEHYVNKVSHHGIDRASSEKQPLP